MMTLLYLLIPVFVFLENKTGLEYKSGTFNAREMYTWGANDTYSRLVSKEMGGLNLLIYQIGFLKEGNDYKYMTLSVDREIKMNIESVSETVCYKPSMGVRQIEFKGYVSISSAQLRRVLGMGINTDHKVKVITTWDERVSCTSMSFIFNKKYGRLCFFQSSDYANSFWKN